MAHAAVADVPASAGDVIRVPATRPLYAKDLAIWASGKADQTTNSATDAANFAAAIGFVHRSTEEKDSQGNRRDDGFVTVARRGTVWLKKNNTTAPTLGQYVNVNAIGTASAEPEYESTATRADALGQIIGWDSPYMHVAFDFGGQYENA